MSTVITTASASQQQGKTDQNDCEGLPGCAVGVLELEEDICLLRKQSQNVQVTGRKRGKTASNETDLIGFAGVTVLGAMDGVTAGLDA